MFRRLTFGCCMLIFMMLQWVICYLQEMFLHVASNLFFLSIFRVQLLHDYVVLEWEPTRSTECTVVELRRKGGDLWCVSAAGEGGKRRVSLWVLANHIAETSIIRPLDRPMNSNMSRRSSTNSSDL